MPSPCTLAHALELTPPSTGQYIELATGEYQNAGTLTVTGTRWLVGRGASQSTVQNMSTGDTFVVDANSTATFDSLQIANTMANASGIHCPITPPGPRVLAVVDALFTNNSTGIGGIGVDGGTTSPIATVSLLRSTFDGNGSGAILSANVTADRCSFTSNGEFGVFVSGNFGITNSFMTRNGVGVVLEGATIAPVFAFNTVVDNTFSGLNCSYSGDGVAIAVESAIIARNVVNLADKYGTAGASNCTVPGSIIATDIVALQFVSPNTAPYDYHLLVGSTAIDAATSSIVDHDFDGDPRPKGNGWDVGADEAF